MSKYITEFQETGNSTVNIELICKDWKDRFSICTWINDNEEKYTFVVNGKRKNTRLCKTKISKEQATMIIHRLNLVHVKAGIPRSAGAYHSKEFVKSECERIRKIEEEKEQELTHIRHIRYEYEMAL